MGETNRTYATKLVSATRELSPKERVAVKMFTGAEQLDELTQRDENGVLIDIDYVAVVEVYNEKSDNKNYIKFVYVDKDGTMYISGSETLYRTYEEIAEEMEIPVEKVMEIQKIAQDPVSLETPIGEEDDSHLGDFIQDDDSPAPQDSAAYTMLKEQLNDVMGTLTSREAKVLRLRFGLEDGKARTLEEVGKEFNVTRERIRQIEAKALRKLRHPSRSKKLRDYMN